MSSQTPDVVGYENVPTRAVTVAEHRQAAEAHRQHGRTLEAEAHAFRALEMANKMRRDASTLRGAAETVLDHDGYTVDDVQFLLDRADRLDAEADAAPGVSR